MTSSTLLKAIQVSCIIACIGLANAIQESRVDVKQFDDGDPASNHLLEEGSLATYDSAPRQDLGRLFEKTLWKATQGIQVFARVLSVATGAISKLSRHALSEVKKSIWFDKANEAIRILRNQSARTEVVSSARGVMLATYSKAPHVMNNSRVLLDSFAQFSLEKAVEAIDVGGRHAEFLGKHAGIVLSELSLATERIIESEHTKRLLRALRFQAENLMITSKQAGMLILNRALWSVAEYSHWVEPVLQKPFRDGSQLTVFADANNLYTAIPILTKGHEYLGTFSGPPTEGYMTCAEACWQRTQRAYEACSGMARLRFGLGPRCSICHSFVWYSPKHPTSNLASKCFAISAPSWTLTYEINAYSGRFLAQQVASAGAEGGDASDGDVDNQVTPDSVKEARQAQERPITSTSEGPATRSNAGERDAAVSREEPVASAKEDDKYSQSGSKQHGERKADEASSTPVSSAQPSAQTLPSDSAATSKPSEAARPVIADGLQEARSSLSSPVPTAATLDREVHRGEEPNAQPLGEVHSHAVDAMSAPEAQQVPHDPSANLTSQTCEPGRSEPGLPAVAVVAAAIEDADKQRQASGGGIDDDEAPIGGAGGMLEDSDKAVHGDHNLIEARKTAAQVQSMAAGGEMLKDAAKSAVHETQDAPSHPAAPTPSSLDVGVAQASDAAQADAARAG